MYTAGHEVVILCRQDSQACKLNYTQNYVILLFKPPVALTSESPELSLIYICFTETT